MLREENQDWVPFTVQVPVLRGGGASDVEVVVAANPDTGGQALIRYLYLDAGDATSLELGFRDQATSHYVLGVRFTGATGDTDREFTGSYVLKGPPGYDVVVIGKNSTPGAFTAHALVSGGFTRD